MARGHIIIASIWGVVIISECYLNSAFLAIASAAAYFAEIHRSSAHLRANDA